MQFRSKSRLPPTHNQGVLGSSPSGTTRKNHQIKKITAQAESTVDMLNWAIRSVKFLGVEFD